MIKGGIAKSYGAREGVVVGVFLKFLGRVMEWNQGCDRLKACGLGVVTLRRHLGNVCVVHDHV